MAEEFAVQISSPPHGGQPPYFPGGRHFKMPSHVTLPVRVTRTAMMTQSGPGRMPPDASGGLWFLALDRNARFSKWSRWPATESGPLGRFVPLMMMDMKPDQPFMKMSPALNVIVREGDEFIIDSSFISGPTADYGVWQITNIIYEHLTSDEIAALEPIADDSAATPGIDADTVLNVNFENAEFTSSAVDTSDYFKPKVMKSIDPANPHAFISGGAYLSTDGVISGDTSMRFDGTGIVSFEYDPHFNPLGGDWLWEVKVRPADVSGTHWRAIISGGSAYAPIGIYQQGNQYQFWSSKSGTSWDVASGVSVGTAAAGTATKLRVQRNGSTITTYQDDALISTVSVTGSLMNNGGKLFLGNKDIGGSTPFTGLLDDVYMRKVGSFMSAGSTPLDLPYYKGP